MSSNFFSKHEIEELCIAGQKSPSAGNNQPWLVKIRSNTFQIRLNKERLGDVKEADYYFAIFSLGCFVENIILQSSKLGMRVIWEVETTNYVENFAVLLNFERLVEISPHPLALYINKRRTNRKLSDGTILADSVIKDLDNIIRQAPELRLDSVTSYNDKLEVADILGLADQLRMNDRNRLEAMMSEMRYSDKESLQTRDGLDLNTLELPGNLPKMFLLLKNNNFLADLLPKRVFHDLVKPLILGSSHICFISSCSEITPLLTLRAGMVTELLWLEVTGLQLALHPWTAFVYFSILLENFSGNGLKDQEIKELKQAQRRLNKILSLPSDSKPLFIFRLSKADPPTAFSLRIPMKQFIKING